MERWRQLLWRAAGKFSWLVRDGLCVPAGICVVCPASVRYTRLHSRLLGETIARLLLDRNCTDPNPVAECDIGPRLGPDRASVAITGHSHRDRAGGIVHGTAILVAGSIQSSASGGRT